MKKILVVLLLALTFTACSDKENTDTLQKEVETKEIAVDTEKMTPIQVEVDRLKVEGLTDEENKDVNEIFSPALDEIDRLFEKGINNATKEEQDKVDAMMEEMLSITIKKYPTVTEEKIGNAFSDYAVTLVDSLPKEYKETVYETQIQKARDSNRIMDLMTIDSTINQYYMDNDKFPDELNTDYLGIYLLNGELPRDEFEGQTINGCEFGYKYELEEEEGNNEYMTGIYRLSTCFESEKNIKSKAMTDGGMYDNRYEIGNFEGQ